MQPARERPAFGRSVSHRFFADVGMVGSSRAVRQFGAKYSLMRCDVACIYSRTLVQHIDVALRSCEPLPCLSLVQYNRWNGGKQRRCCVRKRSSREIFFNRIMNQSRGGRLAATLFSSTTRRPSLARDRASGARWKPIPAPDVSIDGIRQTATSLGRNEIAAQRTRLW